MVQWLEWSDDAFERARQSGRPVLLYIKAAWCRWCVQFEREVLGDPRVQATLEAHFTPVPVDRDRRPDLDARYSKGGWPTLTYLDERGEPIASDGYLEVDELLGRLDLVASYQADARDSVRRRLCEADDALAAQRARTESVAGVRELSPEILVSVTRLLVESADPQFGGWGAQHKFPHPEALDYMLVRWSQTGDEALRKLVLRTLRCMQDGEVHDRVEGGFYRYATARDWSAPHYEKLLDSNAQRLHAYLEGYQAFGDESFRASAEGVIAWMHETLLDERLGAFRGSQDADPAYARRGTRAARREHGAPPCDPTIYANWNAIAASALFKSAAVLERPECAASAVRALEFVFEELFDERVGVHHYYDGAHHLPGMLSDQAYVLRAFVDAAQHTGRSSWLERATLLARLCFDTLHADAGGFWDTRHDPGARGALRRRVRPLLENSVLAEALLRLAQLSGDERWDVVARDTLRAFAGDYKRAGHEAAAYARAVDLALHPPVHVTILGRVGADDTEALRRAAFAPYVASRIVQTLDIERDVEWIARLGHRAPSGGAACAYVSRGRESYAHTSNAARLPALMTRIEPAA
jgi:uncharacterized protein YyaL (SSP411 family)